MRDQFRARRHHRRPICASCSTCRAASTRARAMQISFPNGATMSFTAEVSSYEPTVPVDDAMTATVTFSVTGQPTMGTT